VTQFIPSDDVKKLWLALDAIPATQVVPFHATSATVMDGSPAGMFAGVQSLPSIEYSK
jgi:hypothetical protein